MYTSKHVVCEIYYSTATHTQQGRSWVAPSHATLAHAKGQPQKWSFVVVLTGMPSKPGSKQRQALTAEV